MDKLLLFVLLLVAGMLMQALQIDQELALQTLYRAKYGANRAAHAAALQIDESKLALGIRTVDATRSKPAALETLRRNLELDSALKPVGGSFLKDPVKLLEYIIVDDKASFPYSYRYGTDPVPVVLDKPGVILVIRVKYPAVYRVLPPVEWTITAASELVY